MLQTWCSFLWPQRSHSLPLRWLGFCFWIIPVAPRFITSIIVFMKFVSWSAHCSKSLSTASCVSFCLTVSTYGTDFAEMCFMSISSFRMDCTNPNKSASSSDSFLIVILWLSSMAECNINWFLLVGGPPWPFITLDWCLSLFELPKPSLTCIQPIALFPKAFWMLA